MNHASTQKAAMELIVLGLPKAITEAELVALFTPHGAVSVCSLVMDKNTDQSKGFGFVTMDDDSEAQAAIETLHGSKVGGNKIRVKASDRGAA